MFNLEKTRTFQYGSIIGYIYILALAFLFPWSEFVGQGCNIGKFLTDIFVLSLIHFACLISFSIFIIIDYKCYNHIKNIKTAKNSFYRVIQYIGFGIYVLISLPAFIISIYKPPYIGLIESAIFIIIFLCFPNKKSEINQLEEGNINDEI